MGTESTTYLGKGTNTRFLRLLAGVTLFVLTFFCLAQTASAGEKCESVDVSGYEMKVGVGGGATCDEAHDVILRFFDWYENQTGIAQRRRIDDYLCGRASGSLSCDGNPKWIFADGHIGSKPWEWPPPWTEPKPPEPPKGPPFLGRNEAKGFMKEALRRHFGDNWRYRVNTELKCTKRVRKNRVQCQRIAWAIGDLVYWGTGSIWFRRVGGGISWNYSFRIRRLDEYCAFVQNRPVRKCVKKYVVR